MNGLPAGEGSVALRIEDTYAPWNEGLWRFFAREGVLAVERAQAIDAPALSIGDLSCWAFGCADGSGLLRGGAALSAADALAMDQLLPAKPFFIYDTY